MINLATTNLLKVAKLLNVMYLRAPDRNLEPVWPLASMLEPTDLLESLWPQGQANNGRPS